MSIDPNVGALKNYLTKISTSKTFNKIRNDIWSILGMMSKFGLRAQKIGRTLEKSLKSFVLNHSNLFESLNLRYFGPIDGHDLDKLIETLNDNKKIDGPKILHCLTLKGKGFDLAEKNQATWHATGKFDKRSGESVNNLY